MSHRIATIGRYALLEARRTRLPLLALVCFGCLLAASFFVRELAITDSGRFQAAFYAAAVRISTAAVIALHVLASVHRDFQDKVLDAMLALDLPRSHYVVGKLGGFVLIAFVVALAAALPLVPLAGAVAATQWALSLAVEIGVVAGFALFAALSFHSLIPAAALVGAFYLLARVLSAVRLIAAHPIEGAGSGSQEVLHGVAEALALVIPPIDRWTRTEWLVDMSPEWGAVGLIAAHGALLLVLLAAAAAFDMHRRNL